MKLVGSMFFAMLATLFFVTVSTSWARGPIDYRHTKQPKRICRAAIYGKIAHARFMHFNKKQRQIQRAKRHGVKHLHFRHHPVYHGHGMNVIFIQPAWRMGWSFGWR